MRWLLIAVLAAACGDNIKASAPQDAGPGPDAAGRLTGCLDRPGDIPLAPNGQLPCDLVPPGLTL